jgi:hypothetical protein
MARPLKVDKSEHKRVQMDLAPKSLDRLKRLQDITEAASYAEVVRNALRLYEALIAERELGAELQIVRDGKVSPLHIFAG